MINKSFTKNNDVDKFRTIFLQRSSNGFTLIETIIYLALFTIIIGGGMVATYQIIESVKASHNHVILQGEANFLFRKIEWALNGATSITTPSGSTPTTSLVVTKNIYDSPTTLMFTFDSVNNNMVLERDSLGAVILNSSSIIVNSLSFKQDPADSITAEFTLTTYSDGQVVSQNFSMKKYIKK